MEDKILKQIKSEAENIYPRPNADVSTVYRWEQKAFIRGAEYGYNIKESVDVSKRLIDFLIYLNENRLINNHDFDYEKEVNKYLKTLNLSASNQENNSGEQWISVEDIRNKMTPITNLMSMLKHDIDQRSILVQNEIKQCEVSIDYLCKRNNPSKEK